MEEETVLGILMYLYHHHMEQDSEVNLTDMELVDELKSVGFHAHSIGRAFRWLNYLAEFVSREVIPSENSFRVYNNTECEQLDVDCRNFIISLECQGILTAYTREIVIHQAMELAHGNGVDLNLLKWVTLMVLFNLPDAQEALTKMESFVLADTFETVH